MACGVLGVEHQDVVVRLFVKTLQGIVADWFYNLSLGSITSRNTIKDKFEKRFKPIEDEHALLA